MNIQDALMRRRLGMTRRIEIDFAVDRIRLKEAVKLNSLASYNGEEEPMKTYGPLGCTKLNNGILAVANEDGCVNLLRTRPKMENIAHWLGHENAIFDIKAGPDQKTLMTASGDTTIKQWDIETTKDILTLTPHYSSIKSISIYDANTLASGSRDGTIKVHDLRQKNPTVLVIRDAHRNYSIAKARKMSAKTDPISCVTNVAFDPCQPRIYSTGANDATIKLWDIRRYNTMNKPRRTVDGQLLINKPNVEVHHPSKGMHCGYSHLLISPSCKIYAACSDNKIYCYENFCQNSPPTKFTGYQYDTYLKIAVMDDRFLLSGSKGGGAILWTLGNSLSSRYYPETTKQPIGQLKPDQNDQFDTNVIETDWNDLSIFAFRDDRLVCKWAIEYSHGNARKSLAENGLEVDNNIAIQMSDIINVNVLRPSQRTTHANSTQNQMPPESTEMIID